MTSEERDNLEAQRTECEIYSRVGGYIRPVNQWNDGKKAEYADRVTFDLESNSC